MNRSTFLIIIAMVGLSHSIVVGDNNYDDQMTSESNTASISNTQSSEMNDDYSGIAKTCSQECNEKKIPFMVAFCQKKCTEKACKNLCSSSSSTTCSENCENAVKEIQNEHAA